MVSTDEHRILKLQLNRLNARDKFRHRDYVQSTHPATVNETWRSVAFAHSGEMSSDERVSKGSHGSSLQADNFDCSSRARQRMLYPAGISTKTQQRHICDA